MDEEIEAALMCAGQQIDQLQHENRVLRARILELEAVHEDASSAVLKERERCRELADLAVAYAQDGDWSRVTGVLNLIARGGA